MKRILIALTVMLTIAVSAGAMSYNQARREALFLTDKMAYELNLTPEQYDAAYEINLDYLMGVTGIDDVYSDYWTRRNLDLSYILLDWQWNAFRSATYFYKPLYWDGGYWHFGVYARYPRRHFFYFDRPTVYMTYRGDHGWRANGGRSFYYDRRNDFREPRRQELGMRDRWDRGDFGGARNTSGSFNGNNSGFDRNNGNNGFQNGNFGNRRNDNGNNRFSTSSTTDGNNRGSFGGARSSGTFSPSSTGTRPSSSSNGANSGYSQSRTSGSFGGARGNVNTGTSSGTSTSRGSFGGVRSNTSIPVQRSSGSFGAPQRSSGSFGTPTPQRNVPSVSAPSAPAQRGGSFGGARSGGSFGGGSSSSSSGSSNQRGSFGGAR